MELEGLLGADALLPALLGARDVLVEDARALLEGLPERLLLAREPHLDRVRLLGELGVGAAHELAHAAREARQEARLDADPAALQDRAAHEPAQDVAAVLVGGHDAVGDEEGHPARVVGEDAQRTVDLERLAVGAPAELLAEVDERLELVRLEDRRRALEDRREPVEAQPGVDVLRRQRGEDVLRVLVVLHEHEVPVLEEALVVAARQVVGLAEVQPAVEVELRARAARAERAGLPEVLRARQRDDPLARHADGEPDVDRLLVGAEPERLVALEDGDPDLLGIEAEAVDRELPGELRGALLEVVADREVAEHLEEGEVPGRVADVLDVHRPEALLAGREAVVRRALLAEEVRLERVHARRGEQDRRVVVGGDQRRRGQPLVVALGEEGQVPLADLVGGHAPIVTRPPCRTPRPRRPATGRRSGPARCGRRARRARARAPGGGRAPPRRRRDRPRAARGSGA
jgi:hypothetical protein